MRLSKGAACGVHSIHRNEPSEREGKGKKASSPIQPTWLPSLAHEAEQAVVSVAMREGRLALIACRQLVQHAVIPDVAC